VPRAADRHEAPQPAEPAAERPAAAGVTILVVDDEEPVRQVARRLLEEAGYGVAEAVNGRDAVERVGAERDRFALVLLDLTMPVMAGAETLRRLRAVAPDLPVILMSGYGDAEVLRHVPELGAEAFLAKPFTFDSLTAAVGAAVRP
jgi:CheY-like chemotaxis protein